jgi:hypothetical protein
MLFAQSWKRVAGEGRHGPGGPETRIAGGAVPHKWRAAAFYLLLTLVLTYPLSLAPHRTVLAHYPDDELLMWVLAWDAHAFLHQPLSIFDANIFYPQRRTLAYSENVIGSAFFAAPVLWITGNPALALNIVALLACVLCGLGGYVLGYRVGLSPPAALVCGVIYAFSPPRFFRTPQIHVGAVQWIPFSLASLHAYFDGHRKRDLRLAVAFFTLQTLTSGHGAVFLAVAIVIFLAYRLVLGDPLAPVRRARDLGVPGLLLLAPAALLYLPYRVVQEEIGLRRGLGTWRTTLESYLASPTHLHVWLRPFLTDRDVLAEATAILFVGYLPLVLAVIAVVRGRRTAAAAGSPRSTPVWARIGFALEAAALIAFITAGIVTFLGPIRLRVGTTVLLSAREVARSWFICALIAGLRVALVSRAPLDIPARVWRRAKGLVHSLAARPRDPATFYVVLAVFCAWLMISPPSSLWRFGLWRFVYGLPGFSFIRISTRFVVLLVLAIAVLAATGVESVTARLTPQTRLIATSLVIAVLIAEFAAIPLNVVAYRINPPAVDRWVARQPKPFVVAELPLVEGAPRYQTAYMLHSTTHWQKTVNGYSGWLPATHRALYEELRNFPDAQSVEHLEQIGVTYVIVHRDMFAPAEWKRFETQLGAFDGRLKLEYMDPSGQVFSLPKRQNVVNE